MRSNNRRLQGAAAAFIENQLKVGRVAFSLTHLMDETGLSASAARNQLSRLGSRVVRVAPKQSFFLIVSPEHSVVGSPPVDWWLDDYFAWLRHPYYLALQSAAALHGSSPQAIQVAQVITDAPRRPVRIGRLKVDFFVKRRIQRTLTEPATNVHAPLQVSSRATTVFDLVRYAGPIGGVGRAIETLRPLLGKLKPAELAAMLEAERERATAQRLGYLVERFGYPKLADAIDRWLPRKRPLIRLARESKAGQGPVAARWRVIDNSGEFGP